MNMQTNKNPDALLIRQYRIERKFIGSRTAAEMLQHLVRAHS